MAIGITKRRVFESERDLLDFARSYLSEAFPNPEHKGCPPDGALSSLATRPTRSHPSISNHLTCCSPCFNAYMAHLARTRAELLQLQRICRAAGIRRFLVTAGAAVILMIALYVFFIRRHDEPTVAPRMPAPTGEPTAPAPAPAVAMYVPVRMDLSNASPVRGANEGEARPSPQVIPSSPLVDSNLLLPLGSEERQYSLKLSSKRNVVWSGSAQARLKRGQMNLRLRADFSHVPAGNYNLVVASRGFALTAPVLVKSTSPGGIKP
jgi:hypothetical protein